MYLLRRSAFRAVSSPSTSFISKQRSITTSFPFALRSKVQSGITPSVFRRFASDESGNSSESGINSADGEQGSVSQAVDSVKETLSEYASNAAETVSNAATGAAAAAGIAYQPREDRRESRPYEKRGGDRGDRSGDRGGDRGGYGGDRRGGRYDDRGGRSDERAPRSFGSRDGGNSSFGGPRPDRLLTPNPNLYVGNLLFDVTSEDLQKEFSEFGTIKHTTIATDARGLSKGFGYVEFESTEQATAAIAAKHQSILEGRRLIVNYQSKTASFAANNEPSKTLFVGNLAFEMSDADLNKLFRDIRNVIDVRVAIDRRTGQPRGFAHADFVDVDSAVKAKEILATKEIYGRTLRVDFSASSRNTFASKDGESSDSKF